MADVATPFWRSPRRAQRTARGLAVDPQAPLVSTPGPLAARTSLLPFCPPLDVLRCTASALIAEQLATPRAAAGRSRRRGDIRDEGSTHPPSSFSPASLATEWRTCGKLQTSVRIAPLRPARLAANEPSRQEKKLPLPDPRDRLPPLTTPHVTVFAGGGKGRPGSREPPALFPPPPPVPHPPPDPPPHQPARRARTAVRGSRTSARFLQPRDAARRTLSFVVSFREFDARVNRSTCLIRACIAVRRPRSKRCVAQARVQSFRPCAKRRAWNASMRVLGADASDVQSPAPCARRDERVGGRKAGETERSGEGWEAGAGRR